MCERERERERDHHCTLFRFVKRLTAVPSLHFSSARGPARGAVVTRSHYPGSDVSAAVSVTQKYTFSWVRKKNIKNQKMTFMFSKKAQSII